MATFGYARVSTDGQTLEAQIAALRATGCERVFKEKVTGAHQSGRSKLARGWQLQKQPTCCACATFAAVLGNALGTH
jgi:resolvase-like protein